MEAYPQPFSFKKQGRAVFLDGFRKITMRVGERQYFLRVNIFQKSSIN